MERLERLLPYCVALAAIGALVVSGRPAGGPPVRAAEPEENDRLDVLRRAVAFAQDSAIRATEKAVEVERGPLTLDELQRAISFALQTSIAERERGTRLDKSSTMGDREQARDAFTRAAEWQKLEQILRAMYGSKVTQLKEEFERCKVTGKEYRARAQLWQSPEQELRTVFAAEIDTAKKAAGVGK